MTIYVLWDVSAGAYEPAELLDVYASQKAAEKGIEDHRRKTLHEYGWVLDDEDYRIEPRPLVGFVTL